MTWRCVQVLEKVRGDVRERRPAWQCTDCNLVYVNWTADQLEAHHRCPAKTSDRPCETQFPGGSGHVAPKKRAY